MATRYWLAAGALVALVSACKKKDDPDVKTPITVATYNAGLAVGFVPGTESRAPLVAEALSGLDADVVCLQEVWLPEHVAAIEAAVDATYPNRFVPDPLQSSDAACQPGDLDGLLTCIEDSCDFSCADSVPTCLFEECTFDFLNLSKDCMRCAMANVGEDPATVAETCGTAPIEYAYGGSFGTMLLSKHPIGIVDQQLFASTSNRRSVMHTVVDAPGGDLSVFCTHLTAVFDTIPYPRDTGSWADEQLVQIEELNAFADTVGGEYKVLLGDLNTGPGLDGITAEAPAGYAALVDAGWDVPYTDLDGRCTFCGDNPLIASADDNDNRLIDHVMTKGSLTATAASRILDGTVEADSCAMPGVTTLALSDHYGIEVTLQR